MTAEAPPPCGAGNGACRFEPVATVTFDVPAGHELGDPSLPTVRATSSCAVHLDHVVAVVESRGFAAQIRRLKLQ